MNVNILTVEDLNAFRIELVQEFKAMFAQSQSLGHGQWLRSNEACRLLRVCPGTLRNMRRKGALKGKKVGRIVFYRYDDICRMISGRSKKKLKR